MEKKENTIIDGMSMKDLYEKTLKVLGKSREDWSFEEFLNDMDTDRIGKTGVK